MTTELGVLVLVIAWLATRPIERAAQDERLGRLGIVDDVVVVGP